MAGELATRSWPSVPESPMVLVPMGSTEQHGPHLPLCTDTLVATAVAYAVCDRIGAAPQLIGEVSVLVAPAVGYGASGEHADFPGTVSLGHEALSALLIELVRSLSLWAGRIVIVNGHGGNVSTLTSVVPLMIGEHHRLSWIPCGVADGDAHAGRTETSLLLHLAPELVRIDAIAPGNSTPVHDLMPRLMAEGVRAVSPTGVLGDPTGATAANGVALFDTIVADACGRITRGTAGADGMLRDSR